MSKSLVNTPVDPTIDKVSVRIGGKDYRLAFDFNALARAEELTGINLLRSLDMSGLNASAFRALLWASLLKFQPEITLEETGALIRPETSAKLTKALVAAYSDSTDEPEDADPNAQEPQKK